MEVPTHSVVSLVVGGPFASAFGRGWGRSTLRPFASESGVLLCGGQLFVLSCLLVESFLSVM